MSVTASGSDSAADDGRRKSVRFPDPFPAAPGDTAADGKAGGGGLGGLGGDEDILAHIAALQGKVRDVKESLLQDPDGEFAWDMPGPQGDVDQLMPVGLDGGGSILSAMTGFDDGFGGGGDDFAATDASVASESKFKGSPPPAAAARKTASVGRESKGYK